MKSEKKFKSETKIAGKRCHDKRGHHHEKQENVQGAFAFVKNKEGSSRKQEKHMLKKKIVKILRKRGQVSFDGLIRKLDVDPRRLFKILTKLERKGVVAQEGRTHHHHHHHKADREFGSGEAEKVKQHKRKRLEKLRRKMAHHGAHEDKYSFKRGHGRHHHNVEREGCAECLKHCIKHQSRHKGDWRNKGTLQFVLA